MVVSGELGQLVAGLSASVRVDKAPLKQFYLQVLQLPPVIYNSTSTTYSCVFLSGGWTVGPLRPQFNSPKKINK